jgi:hypothetical protein
MNIKLQMTWNDSIMAYCKVLSRYLSGRTEKDHENLVRIADHRIGN